LARARRSFENRARVAESINNIVIPALSRIQDDIHRSTVESFRTRVAQPRNYNDAIIERAMARLLALLTFRWYRP